MTPAKTTAQAAKAVPQAATETKGKSPAPAAPAASKPGQPTASAGAKPSPAPKRAAATKSKSGSAASLTPAELWNKAMRSASQAPPIPYSISKEFEQGQKIKHPTFGEGVVIRISSRTVCEVAFPEGSKKLLMSS
ncbi:MAG: hypothetical protein ACKPBU_17145 [Alphaproteobacteria bacterium]